MIYCNGKELIIVWVHGIDCIEFETHELESCKYKMKISSEGWLFKNNYNYIGNF